MQTKRLIGIALVVIGAFLLYFGYNASQSFGEQIGEGLTGHFSDKTTWYLIGGGAAVVAGLALSVFAKK